MPDNTTPAFPIQASDVPGAYCPDTGLSKREYAAIHILAGYIGGAVLVNDNGMQSRARAAVAQADALLAALKE